MATNEVNDAMVGDCPRCKNHLEVNWFVCPYCGTRIRPGDDLIQRSFTWLLIISGFLLALTIIAQSDEAAATGLGMIFGIPLAYVFGKAVLFRILGKPLGWDRLGAAAVRSFLFLVVAPMAIGLCVLILGFIACITSMPSFHG